MKLTLGLKQEGGKLFLNWRQKRRAICQATKRKIIKKIKPAKLFQDCTGFIKSPYRQTEMIRPAKIQPFAKEDAFLVSFSSNQYTGHIVHRNLNEILEEIKNGKWKFLIEQTRELYLKYLETGNDKLYRKRKNNLPLLAVSGLFREHFFNYKPYLHRYTQWMMLDIDANPKHNPSLKTPEDAETLKERLKQEPFIYAAFISCSGRGLKILLKGNQTQQQHKILFNQLAGYFKSKYGIVIDASCKNINRLGYVSHDHRLYLNPEASIYEIDFSAPVQQKDNAEAILPEKTGETLELSKKIDYRADNTEILNAILDYLQETKQSITYDYNDWMRVGFALINEFKKDLSAARDYFHQFSKMDIEKYEPINCDRYFDGFIRNRKQKINIATIIFLAKKKGFQISDSTFTSKLSLSINLLKFLQYGEFLKTLEEIVLFEYLVTKSLSFGMKEFFHSTATIEKEVRIKRKKQNKIIQAFIKHGILSVDIKGFPKVKYFKMNFDRVVELFPQIYSVSSNKQTNKEELS